MLKCSKEAFAACPDRHLCGCVEEATFTEGSECDKFNRQIGSHVMTHGDQIRAMSDEELEWAIDPAIVPPGISIREWLRQPAKNPVEWSKSGPCPVTPDQFNAVYDDAEAT